MHALVFNEKAVIIISIVCIRLVELRAPKCVSVDASKSRCLLFHRPQKAERDANGDAANQNERYESNEHEGRGAAIYSVIFLVKAVFAKGAALGETKHCTHRPQQMDALSGDEPCSTSVSQNQNSRVDVIVGYTRKTGHTAFAAPNAVGSASLVAS